MIRLEMIDSKIDTLKVVRRLAEMLQDEEGFFVSIWGEPMIVGVAKSVEELTRLRHVLRRRLWGWNDRVTDVGVNVLKELYADYRNPNKMPVKLRLKGSEESFPRALFGEGCRIEKVEDSYWSLVCGR